jgi:hypothetical protein
LQYTGSVLVTRSVFSYSLLAQLQRRHDARDDLARTGLDGDGERPLISARFLERLKLAMQKALRHKMLVPGGDAACDKRLLAFEIDEADIGTVADEHFAIAAFERRASDDRVIAATTDLVNPFGNRSEPRLRSSSVSGVPLCIFSMFTAG